MEEHPFNYEEAVETALEKGMAFLQANPEELLKTGLPGLGVSLVLRACKSTPDSYDIFVVNPEEEVISFECGLDETDVGIRYTVAQIIDRRATQILMRDLMASRRSSL